VAENQVLETDKPTVNPFDDKATIKVFLGEPSSGMIDCIAHDNRLDVYMEYARLEARHALRFWNFAVSVFGKIVDFSIFTNFKETIIELWNEFKICRDLPKFKFFTGNVGRCGVNYAREMMATEAIHQGMDYLFMIDDDMIIPKRCFERLWHVETVF